MQFQIRLIVVVILVAAVSVTVAVPLPAVARRDWPQWGGSSERNNAPDAENIPETWDPGEFDLQLQRWKPQTQKNIKWVVPLGTQTYSTPVISGGKVYIGTNNGHGYLKRYPGAGPQHVDLGCLLCFDERDGTFLWQHSSEKLPSGRGHDWPQVGICCSPLVEGDRLWFVTSRGEVVCLDANGFYDGENDGPFVMETHTSKDEADVVWSFDMMKNLGVLQLHMCNCSVTAADDLLFVGTSNGVGESRINIAAPHAPSFMAMDKHTGKVLWTDASPGLNILEGQWSSPCVAQLGGVLQAIFAGGDGYLYSFRADAGQDGKPTLLWKFDANPKQAQFVLGARGTRNALVGTPVAWEGMVYVAVGRIPSMAKAPVICGASIPPAGVTSAPTWSSM